LLCALASAFVAITFSGCGGGKSGSVPVQPQRDPEAYAAPNLSAPRGPQTARRIRIPQSAAGQVRRTSATNVLQDPGFESAGFTYWAQCGNVNAAMSTTHPHTGTRSMKAGSASTTSGEINGDAGVCQQVTIPSSGVLTFWEYGSSNESSTTYAYQEAALLDSTGAVVAELYQAVDTTSGWVQRSVSVSAYAGQSLWLYFGVHGDGYTGTYTTLYVDDVVLSGGATPTPNPTATPTPGGTPTPKPTATPVPTPTPSGGYTPIPAPNPPGGTCGSSCGVERWHVKTMNDTYAAQVNRTPQVVTVDTLWHAAVPSGLSQSSDNVRFAPWELKAVHLTGKFVGWKTESDNDYHIVIADMNNASETMIIEPPSAACSAACASGYGSLYTAARQAFVNCLGSPPSSFTGSSKNITVDVTGVPMFDLLHGQTGVAPNGIEIHPVISVSLSGC
ncbi:MAG: hypothetical protein QOI11_1135, partial [Candidatus Eremiobacteraeota bacterium]|nr:hypothetical protein [Candidatus Eremiobacteraeota bacterium]